MLMMMICRFSIEENQLTFIDGKDTNDLIEKGMAFVYSNKD